MEMNYNCKEVMLHVDEYTAVYTALGMLNMLLELIIVL